MELSQFSRFYRRHVGRFDEVLACWKQIAAPLLWVEGDRTDVEKWWGHRYPRSEFEQTSSANSGETSGARTSSA